MFLSMILESKEQILYPALMTYVLPTYFYFNKFTKYMTIVTVLYSCSAKEVESKLTEHFYFQYCSVVHRLNSV